MKKSKRNYESEILDIIKTKDWDRAKVSNDVNLYNYIRCHRDTDKNCRIVWEHIISQQRNYKSEVSEIVDTKDWDRAKNSNDRNLYGYICRHKDIDESCRIVLEHIRPRDFESEILDIIKTKDWDRAKNSNDRNLYGYICRHKNTDENCRIIWEYVTENRCYYTIKDYLQYYFEHGKPIKSNSGFYNWIINQVRRGNQCCIDIKNLIIAADTYKDPVAIETLELIKKHLKEEEG